MVAELIREFMEFYHLDYTLAIFGPETNMKGKTTDKEALGTRAGVTKTSKDKPILQQLIEMLQSGNFNSAPKPAEKPVEKLEPISMPNVSQKAAKVEDTKKTDMHLNKAQNLLEELQREEKSGFKLNNDSKKNQVIDMGKAGKDTGAKSGTHKKSADDFDNYEEDFDDIEEDLPEGHNDDYNEQDKATHSANIGGSGQGITVS